MKTTLTKKEFITRSMEGEVFLLDGYRYFYDATKVYPFRINVNNLDESWKDFDGNILFEIEKPKPILERRWKYILHRNGYSNISLSYMSDTYAESNEYIAPKWYKIEDMFIDVEVIK